MCVSVEQVLCSRDVAVIFYLTDSWDESKGGVLVDIETGNRQRPFLLSATAFFYRQRPFLSATAFFYRQRPFFNRQRPFFIGNGLFLSATAIRQRP